MQWCFRGHAVYHSIMHLRFYWQNWIMKQTNKQKKRLVLWPSRTKHVPILHLNEVKYQNSMLSCCEWPSGCTASITVQNQKPSAAQKALRSLEKPWEALRYLGIDTSQVRICWEILISRPKATGWLKDITLFSYDWISDRSAWRKLEVETTNCSIYAYILYYILFIY